MTMPTTKPLPEPPRPPKPDTQKDRNARRQAISLIGARQFRKLQRLALRELK